MKNRSRSQSVLIGLFVIMVLAASSPLVRADCIGPVTWVGGKSSWFTGANWNSGNEPGSGNCVFINNGGNAAIPAHSTHAMAYSLVLGDNQGDSGAVSVTGDHTGVLDLGTSACRGDIYIGNRGSGYLTIANGGYVRSRYGYVAAATNETQPPSSGKVVVKGPGVGSGIGWYLYQTGDGCNTGAGLFIGSGGSGGSGGNASVELADGGMIFIGNHADAPGAIVGESGTLSGNGIVQMAADTALGKTMRSYGTVEANGGTMNIQGNLDLELSSNVICHLSSNQVSGLLVSQEFGGGTAFLGGRLTVQLSGAFTTPSDYVVVQANSGFNFTEFAQYSFSGGNPCIIASPVVRETTVSVRLTSSCDE